MPEVAILVTATDKASAKLKKIGGGLGTLGKAAAAAGAAGVVALGAIAAGATKLALDAAKLEPTVVTFDSLTKSIGSTADAMLKKLRPATMGVVSDADLMLAANKMMAMGLAETEDEAAKLSEMATTLGMAMGEDATVAMENFSLMLANQSIPRLDTFGISSGKVRTRITELMEATEDMTREEAFKIAVMEQGTAAMERVGDITGTSAVTMQQMSATIGNLKMTIGQALLPTLKKLLDFLSPLIQRVSDFIGGLTGGEKTITDLPGPIQTVIAVLKQLTEGIETYLVPAVMLLVEWWKIEIDIAKRLAAWIMENLVPAIKELFLWMSQNLGPIFREFAEEMGPRLEETLKQLKQIFGEVGERIQENVVPAMQALWDRTEGFRQALEAIMKSAAVEGLRTFLRANVIAFDMLAGAIRGVGNAMTWLIDKIREVLNWLQSLGDRIPSWLKPGSASPLEISIKGIADAFGELNAQMMLQPYTMSPATIVGAGGGETIINVGGVYGAWGPEETIEDAFRDAARYTL